MNVAGFPVSRGFIMFVATGVLLYELTQVAPAPWAMAVGPLLGMAWGLVERRGGDMERLAAKFQSIAMNVGFATLIYGAIGAAVYLFASRLSPEFRCVVVGLVEFFWGWALIRALSA